jgi:hypothetical protein
MLLCSARVAWNAVQTSALLAEISYPLVTFSAVDPDPLPAHWTEAATVRLVSSLFGWIPLGERTLFFEQVSPNTMTIQTRERDPLIQRWDHRIQIHPMGEGLCRYSDAVAIDAGLLTVPIYLFAQLFFRHRHRKWRRVAQRLQSQSAGESLATEE